MIDGTSRGLARAFRFILANLGRILIGTILFAILCGIMSIVLPYQREKRIGERIKALDGNFSWGYCGPYSLYSYRSRLPFFDRVTRARLNAEKLSPEFVSDLGSLQHLQQLFLIDAGLSDGHAERLKALRGLGTLYITNNPVTDVGLHHLTCLRDLSELGLDQTQITNDGLVHLQGLSQLNSLYLKKTAITDRGLEHLQRLTNLTRLELNDTGTTAEGRELLRKSLPDCMITPNP